MGIRPVEVELFHAEWRTDEQTDMTQLIVVFRNFAVNEIMWTKNVQTVRPLRYITVHAYTCWIP